MKQIFSRHIFLPVGVWTAILAGLWAAVLYGIHDGSLQAVAILLMTLAVLPLVAAPATIAARSWIQRGMVLSFLADMTLLSLVVLAMMTPLDWRDTLAAGAVIGGWCLAVVGLAQLFGVISNGLGIVVAMCIHMICLWALVIAPAVFRWVDVSWHGRVASVIGWICPALALQDSTQGTLGFSWPQMDVMYTLTTFNQDIPLIVPTWWHAALVYAIAGIVLMLMKKCCNAVMP